MKISDRMEEEGSEPGFDDMLRLVTDNVSQTVIEFASILLLKLRSASKGKPFSMKCSQGSGCLGSVWSVEMYIYLMSVHISFECL